MNLNPKQPSGTDPSPSPSSARRSSSSWLSKLSGRSDSGKPKEAKPSSSDTASITSHTPLVASDGGSQTASTTYERSSFVELMNKANGMTPEQLKVFLANNEKEHEAKYHTVAGVGRWQWKFKER
jgi:hypothetical protein